MQKNSQDKFFYKFTGIYSFLHPFQNFALWTPLTSTKGDYRVLSDPIINFFKCFKKELNEEM